MFCYLDFRCYFEANGQNHIHFRLIQFLKNSIAWHFLTFTSPSSKLEFVYPPCCGVEEKMLIFSSVNTWTSQKRLLNWNPIPKLTIVLIWKTPACCRKFATKKTLSLSSERSTLSPTELPRVYISAWRNALWLNAMHCGKKWWIREFVSPYIFPLNPDYVAARSLRSLRSNNRKNYYLFHSFYKETDFSRKSEVITFGY